MKKLFLSIIIGLCILVPIQSSCMTRNEASSYINKSLRNLKTVAFGFKQLDGDKNSGFLKAKKGNKYLLSSSGRKIYCDSKKVWNYSVKENQVLISDYSSSETTFSLDNIFFGIANNYSVQGFAKEKKTGLFVLTLKINDSVAAKIKTKCVKIWLTSEYKIKYLSTDYNDTTIRFLITDLVLNPALKESTFKFVAPKECKVIDL